MIHKGQIDVNDNIDGQSLLCVAAKKGHLDLVELLINSNANLEFVFQGKTPIMLAHEKGHTECVRMLYIAGASIENTHINMKYAFYYGWPGNYCLLPSVERIKIYRVEKIKKKNT